MNERRCPVCEATDKDSLPGVEAIFDVADEDGNFRELDAKRTFEEEYNRTVTLTMFKRHLSDHIGIEPGENLDDTEIYKINGQ